MPLPSDSPLFAPGSLVRPSQSLGHIWGMTFLVSGAALKLVTQRYKARSTAHPRQLEVLACLCVQRYQWDPDVGIPTGITPRSRGALICTYFVYSWLM